MDNKKTGLKGNITNLIESKDRNYRTYSHSSQTDASGASAAGTGNLVSYVLVGI
jgi:hypothetical protein